jgi:hypothetical protein
MMDSGLTIEEVTDASAIEAARGRAEQARVNADWLESHWFELLPGARGKFIAVAGGEGFVAESVQAAWAWVDKTHPGDAGAFVRYVPSIQGPRIYANRRRLAHV